jgi:erythromycin esterase-like protein
MVSRFDTQTAPRIRDQAIRLTGAQQDYDALMGLIGDAQLVFLGEASHGTHEFYRERARITRRLIEERGFNAVAIEGDWPDAYRACRYAIGYDDDPNADSALAGFQRFPNWMWRNEDVVPFIDWLRAYNSTRQPENRTSFYGIDLYSLYRSIYAVIAYLDKVDPAAAIRARQRYACFGVYQRDERAYGMRTTFGESESCEDEAVQQLLDLLRTSADHLRHDGRSAVESAFYAEQNARVVVNAERYYRLMYRGSANTWNLRDRHMADTIDALIEHLNRHGRPPKIAVWAHNSHTGDARATDMSARGELNIGQLARERYGESVRLIGFSTYAGTVTAASDWGGATERKRVRPGLQGSYENLFHEAHPSDFMLLLRDPHETRRSLGEARLERAIGVIYRPETERWSHYFRATLPRQFDAVLHFDETEAVRPLEFAAVWEEGEPPETFPYGF